MAPSRRAGFTLVEILVVITIIGLLMGLAVPVFQNVQDGARVTTCQSNLRQMALNLTYYKTTRNKGRWPKERGIRFLLTSAKAGDVDPKDMKVFLCPGAPSDDNLEGQAYSDWDNLDSTTISYAGRDNVEFPININKEGSEIIASDDNENRGETGNHRNATNYVYADGTPASMDIEEAANRGYDLGGLPFIPIGPDSPFPEFQKLLID